MLLPSLQASTGFGQFSMPDYTSGIVQPLPLPPPPLPTSPPSPPPSPPPPPPLALAACGISTFVDMDLFSNDLYYVAEDSSAPVADGVDQCCHNCMNNTDCFAYVYQPSTGNVCVCGWRWGGVGWGGGACFCQYLHLYGFLLIWQPLQMVHWKRVHSVSMPAFIVFAVFPQGLRQADLGPCRSSFFCNSSSH